MKILSTNLINVCFVTALLIFSHPLIAATIDLTNAEWNITGSDDGGGLWDGSTIHFESQVSNNQNYVLTGYFDWIGSGNQTGSFGRENFTGTLFSDNRIQIIGFEIEPPSQGIVFAAYSAELAPSGTEMINGIWGLTAGGPNVIPGSWSANQSVGTQTPTTPVPTIPSAPVTPATPTPAAVPVPMAVWLFSSGLFGLFGLSRNKKHT